MEELKQFAEVLKKVPRRRYVDLEYIPSTRIEEDIGGEPAYVIYEIAEELGEPIEAIWGASDGGLDWNLVIVRFEKGYCVVGGAPLSPTFDYYKGLSLMEAERVFLKQMLESDWMKLKRVKKVVSGLKEEQKQHFEKLLEAIG